MKKKKKSSEKVRRFWKVEITPEFAGFERLAAKHGMNNAQFFRAIPGLFNDHTSKSDQRLRKARSLRYLECIYEKVCLSGQTLSPELQKLLEVALQDIRDDFNPQPREPKK